MKTSGELKLFSLVIILTGALLFIGINHLEAKKPPKWEWKIDLPNILMAESEECNLYANPHGNQSPVDPGYVTYENNDSVEVLFWTSEDTDTGEFHSIFSLKIENTQKGISDASGYYSVGFRDIEFMGCKSYCLLGGTGPCLCWAFPNYGLIGEDCCEVDCYGTGSSGYWVMQEFMENNAHPSYEYDHFSLRFWVNVDIEALEIGESWLGEGYLWWLNIWNTSDILLTGSEQYHNVVPQSSVPLEGVHITRSGENEWIVTVDQCGVAGEECPPSAYGHSGRYIAFWEMYYQGIEKQKGKSGKTYIDSESRRALGAATPFKFITKWTKF